MIDVQYIYAYIQRDVRHVHQAWIIQIYSEKSVLRFQLFRKKKNVLHSKFFQLFTASL